MAPVRKKRVSKKNKKSWRKNVDLKDVDNFLEDQRLEERLGFKHAEKKDEDLFEIDTKGENKNLQCDVKVPKRQQIKTNSGGSLRLRETELPRCFSALVNKSAVPPHIIKKTRVRKENCQSVVARKIIKKNLRKEILKTKNKIEGQGNDSKESKPKQEFNYDVWSKENNERDLNGCSEWLTSDAIRHTLHNTGNVKKKIPKAILSKTSFLPAVEPPHPGLSYNPSLKDHKDVLNKVVETEVQVMKEEKHIQRVTTKMFEKKPRQEVEQQWLSEMTVGLTMEKTQSDDDDDDDCGEYKALNSPVRNKKKTLQKRRKLREALLLKEKLRQQKIEKKKISDIYKLKKIKEMLDKKEEEIRRNVEKRKEIKEKKLYTTKTLSQTKYQEPEIEFNLAEELSGNLRNIKPEGNLLYERFKSLQKRNILQPTMKRHVKKRMMKKYERANTKMGWEAKGYVPFEKSEKKGIKMNSANHRSVI